MLFPFLLEILLKHRHILKQGLNKLSGRLSLLTPTLPPEEGKRRKRERDLHIEYKSFTNNTENNTQKMSDTGFNENNLKLLVMSLQLEDFYY